MALEAALAELEGLEGHGRRIADLRDARGDVGRLPTRRSAGDLDDATTERIDAVIGRIEAALRARSAAGVD